MDVPVRFIDSIINNPLLMQFLVHRWFFLLEYDPRLDQLRVYDTRSRTLETLGTRQGLPLHEQSGYTDIFIYPGYRFKMIDGLITNFHLPESTLLMLVSALAGKEHIMAAYEEAVKERYRFFSFGDAMFIE